MIQNRAISALALAVSLGWAMPAHAQSAADFTKMKVQMEAMQAQLDAMKSKVDTLEGQLTQAQAEAQTATAAAQSATASAEIERFWIISAFPRGSFCYDSKKPVPRSRDRYLTV